MPRCSALIVAAGSGQRFGGEVPKQYRLLAGTPVLRRTVLAFLRHPAIGRVQVVINPDHRPWYDMAVDDLALPAPVAGGATRQASSLAGLETIAAAGDSDRVLIHDAARPLVDAETIARVVAALDDGPAVLAARPVTDTLKRVAEGRSVGTVDRSGLWRAETPQGFHLAAIRDAYAAVGAAALAATDDAGIAEAAGLSVAVVEGAADNPKITTEADLDGAAQLLAVAEGGIVAPAETRTGHGYDVHRLVPGDAVILCGVRIDHDAALSGHSDADVGLHALTDAILGALADGDIGSHFPPSDPQWRGADSARFLVHAADRVRGAGARIAHVDVTLICEAPKIGPHRDAMRARVASLLDLDASRVSVKATTTERLGFAGRREGIAAQATATLAFPAAGPGQ